jgi:hypothetical protein
MGLAAEFHKYFSGFEKAYGEYTIKGKDEKKGKIKGQAYTRSKPTTEALWKKHLEGTIGLGIPPLRADNTVYFAAIDVDEYPLDHNKLNDLITELKLPLTLCKSKSGGAHLYVFFSDPVKASLVVPKLKKWADALGYADVEVFPKQTEHYDEKSYGNWINMPYFAANDTIRPAVVDGRELKPMAFIKHVAASRISEAQFKKINIKVDKTLDGAPPCIKKIWTFGLDQYSGERDVAYYNIATFLKMKYGDETDDGGNTIWETKYWEFFDSNKIENQPRKEVAKTFNAVDKELKFYTCSQDPCHRLCDKPECNKQEFGVGGSGPGFEITRFIKYEDSTGAFVKYKIYIEESKKINIKNASDFLQYRRFRELATIVLNHFPNQCKDSVWTGMVNNAFAIMELKRAEDDSTEDGIIATEHFPDFVSRFILDDDFQSLFQGRVVRDTKAGTIWFSTKDFVNFLKQQKYSIQSSDVSDILKRYYPSFEDKIKQLKGMRKRFKVINEPELSLQSESYDVPEPDTGGM